MRLGLLCFCIILLLTSCSKSVYVHKDAFGESKYIIYKDNFKYIEKTLETDYKIWGKYELMDSTIVFQCKEEDKIPHNYLLAEVQKLGTSKNPNEINILLIYGDSEEHTVFATVIARDAKGEVLDATDSGFDGVARVDWSEAIHVLEIIPLGSKKQFIDVSKLGKQDLIVKIAEMKMGGRMSSGCLIHYIDYLLEYKINRKFPFDEFEREGIVYTKE